MPVSDEYVTYVLDQLDGMGDLECKRMFGGARVYCDGLFFAIIADDVLYFKVDDFNRADYEAAQMEAFQPFEDKSSVMSYYEVPAGVLENKDQLSQWALKAVHAAAVSKNKGGKKKRKKS